MTSLLFWITNKCCHYEIEHDPQREKQRISTTGDATCQLKSVQKYHRYSELRISHSEMLNCKYAHTVMRTLRSYSMVRALLVYRSIRIWDTVNPFWYVLDILQLQISAAMWILHKWELIISSQLFCIMMFVSPAQSHPLLVIFSISYILSRRWTNDDRLYRNFPLGYDYDMSKSNTKQTHTKRCTKKNYSSYILLASKHDHKQHILVISCDYANSFMKPLSKATKINKPNL